MFFTVKETSRVAPGCRVSVFTATSSSVVLAEHSQNPTLPDRASLSAAEWVVVVVVVFSPLDVPRRVLFDVRADAGAANARAATLTAATLTAATAATATASAFVAIASAFQGAAAARRALSRRSAG